MTIPFLGDRTRLYHPVPLRLPEKTDLQVTGLSSSGVVDISAAFTLVLFDND